MGAPLTLMVPLLTTGPVKRTGLKLARMVAPAELVTGPFTIAKPLLKVMAWPGELVRPPVESVPKPVMTPELLRGWLLLSNVPPARSIVPRLLASPAWKRALAPAG